LRNEYAAARGDQRKRDTPSNERAMATNWTRLSRLHVGSSGRRMDESFTGAHPICADDADDAA